MPAGAARVEQALRPLDELRRVGLRVLAGGWPLGQTLAARRSVRIPVVLSLHALVALVAAVFAPSLLIVVGPLALGVPHLAADVRHLLVRRAWPRWWLAASAGFVVSLLALRALGEAGVGGVSLPVEHALASAWVLLGAVGGAMAAAASRAGGRGWSLRGWAVVAAAAGLGAFALGAPRACRLVLLHAHNIVAIVLWLALFRRGRLALVPVAIALAGGAALASGALLGVTVRHGALSVAGLHLFAAADWLAPGLPDSWAIAVATSFAFLQSVHYAIWLVAIPAGDRPGEGGRSWRVAFRELVRDFTPRGVFAVAVLAMLVATFGLLHAASTRRLVLSLATFHVWLELAVLAYFLARGAERTSVSR
ncbi:MAG TPA: hypothetical protein VN903_24250 [Polyangia bacterium]|jgi:hypothetical protein|nr:hypothetical protein [Polyangia bacterium]